MDPVCYEDRTDTAVRRTDVQTVLCPPTGNAGTRGIPTRSVCNCGLQGREPLSLSSVEFPLWKAMSHARTGLTMTLTLL